MEKAKSEFRLALETACGKALAHLENLEQASVAATVDVNILRSRLAKRLTNQGLAPQRVVEELAADVQGGLTGTAGGRFFGWVIGGALPAALAADWLTGAWDQNAGLYACSPAAAVVEEVAGEWLKEILSLPAEASFALVTGCQMAHVTCLAAARHELLSKRGWDVEQQGLYGAPKIRILANGQKHGSVDRAVRMLGMGLSQVVSLATDSQGRLQSEALRNALECEREAPAIVLLQAGDVNTGACDDYEALIPLAKKHGAWVHVDGAFGLWAAASPRYAHMMRGVAAADSWATDGHKWLNVPYDCGFAFVARAEPHRAAMAYHAAYLTHANDRRDSMDWNPEFSRRARGFSTYAALRELGRDGIAALIERCCKHAESLVNGIGCLRDAEVLSPAMLNQGLVRFRAPKSNATEADHDRRTDETIAGILASGEAFFTGTTWQGRRAMRVSVCNWQTSEKDVERAIRAAANVLRAFAVSSD